MKIEFFANSITGRHCYQACLKMVVNHFDNRCLDFQDLELITCNHTGWTWPTAGMIWLLMNGYEIKLIEDFEYDRFALQGIDYLTERYGAEVVHELAANSDINKERKIASIFPVQYQTHAVPAPADIYALLQDGWVVIVNVNANALYDKFGYVGHFVIVCDVTAESVIIHDSGLPPKPYQPIAINKFMSAWGYPSPRDANILAIKKEVL